MKGIESNHLAAFLPSLDLPPGEYLRIWASGKNRFVMPPETLADASSPPPFERVLVRSGAVWRYLLPSAAHGLLPGAAHGLLPGAAHGPLPGGQHGKPPEGWNLPDFDDSAWSQGPSGFGYDDGDDATELPKDTNVVFLRRLFRVDDPGKILQLVLEIDFDDGFVAYLNGARVASVNSPDEDPDFSTIASQKREAGTAKRFDLSPFVRHLRRGHNVIAIAALNDRPSTDMSLIPSLGILPTIPHTDFRLPKKGGTLSLLDPSGHVVDRVVYPEQTDDQSYGRPAETTAPPEASAWAYLITPTPGGPNVAVGHPAPVSARIRLDPAPGTYPHPIEVRIGLDATETATGTVEVRYTTDGSDPVAAQSPEFGRRHGFSTTLSATDPIPVASNTVLRIAAFLGGERVGPIVSGSYFVGRAWPVPIYSISMPRDRFLEVHLKNDARGRPSEREAYLEIFDREGKRVAQTGFGLRLHGGYGRSGRPSCSPWASRSCRLQVGSGGARRGRRCSRWRRCACP